jgi:hypothetical protein
MNLPNLFEELRDTYGNLAFKDFTVVCMKAALEKATTAPTVTKGTPRIFTITHGAEHHNLRAILTVEDLRAIQKRILENDLSRDRLVVDSILSGLITGDLDIYELKQK